MSFDINEILHLQEAIEAYRSAHDDNKASIDESSQSVQMARLAFFAALLVATLSAGGFLRMLGQSLAMRKNKAESSKEDRRVRTPSRDSANSKDRRPPADFHYRTAILRKSGDSSHESA